MGGENESIAKQMIKESSKEEVIGNIRFHLSNGEVHFHDDDNKLKAAIPVSTWHNAFQKLLLDLPNAQFIFPDIKNKTVLKLQAEILIIDRKQKKAKLEMYMSIHSLEISDLSSKLVTLTRG